MLDGVPVTAINADLSTGLDLTRAVPLKVNSGICFQGPVEVGDFDIDFDLAVSMLPAPNPLGRPNSDVVRPWLNGRGATDRNPHKFIIDFGERPRADAQPRLHSALGKAALGRRNPGALSPLARLRSAEIVVEDYRSRYTYRFSS
jgi:hypothetical protein